MIGISAQISIYPLEQADIASPIEGAIAEIEAHGLEPQAGNMSSQLWGDDLQVFEALRAAFARAAESGPTVMVITVSNACPLPAPSGVNPKGGGA